jgi:carboxyl-terminal processing protease
MDWKSKLYRRTVAALALLLAFGAGYQVRSQQAYAESARWVPPQPSPVLALMQTPDGVRLAENDEGGNNQSGRVGPRFASTRPVSYKPDLKPYEMLDEVRRAIRDNFVKTEVDETELTYGAIRGMLSALGDRFTRFLTPEEYEEFQVKSEGEFTGIGARIDTIAKYVGSPASKPYNASRPVIVEPMEGSPALKAGLQKGDVILAIDGHSTADMSDNAVVSFIKGQEGSTVKLKIERRLNPNDAKADPAYKVFDADIVRGIIEVHPVTLKWLPDGVAWLRLDEFNKKSEPEIKAALQKLQSGPDGKPASGLILDLRDNPGGLLDVAVEIGSHFISEGPIVYTRERDGSEQALNADHKLFLNLKMPIVVLINKYSASAAEILTGALKDKKLATVVGEHSYGKASVQVIVELKNGGALVMTTAKYLTPGRHDISEKGISPDVTVESNAADEDPANGNGAQLQKAMQIIEAKNTAGATVAAR